MDFDVLELHALVAEIAGCVQLWACLVLVVVGDVRSFAGSEALLALYHSIRTVLVKMLQVFFSSL